ncbi:serine hydrolase domain-containing protein [Streptomyces griseoviridis]|uniref:Serine hydrolase domain-containing protein n=1 Tax=Streptomyces hintoniae TaxID=3075521 RepID=A0ABU2UCY8_9ACTN|nr:MULTISPECIES: serine hydrolase domain-containing protein [unclassified Streptomyces]MDH6701714.1 CubicO group peptidase (beta-lactamase class C family) [Streptomyces sp. MAA16]MDT0471124.1 serine hydrolase domain-containing protein [Streptomyces sp. DSM 41014]
MSTLHDTLRRYVDDGAVPGAVGLVAHGTDVEAVAVGSVDTGGGSPMARDSIFRVASVTKPITAAAVLALVEDGTLALDAPVAEWLPELGGPVVVRTPQSPLDDIVPAARPVTVEDLLTFKAGWGFPADFSLPAARALLDVHRNGLAPHLQPDQDVWLARLARVPMLRQPGEAWLYNTGSDLQGILVARASGRTFPDFLAERVLGPLGMTDTAFEVPEAKRTRFTTSYTPDGKGGLDRLDTPDGGWSSPPAFASGAGGLVSTADDLLAFGRMLLADGAAPDGGRVLSPASVRRMTTDHLTAAQRDASALFLEGQGWGYGGSVDVSPVAPWNVPGRYGWVGGSGTAAHVIPATATVTVLLTQVAMTGPTPPPLMRAFWTATLGERRG